MNRGEERESKLQDLNHKARRWVVEACHSWLSPFHKLLIRFKKADIAYYGLFMFACRFIAL